MCISSHRSRSSRPGSKPAEEIARENDFLKCACGPRWRCSFSCGAFQGFRHQNVSRPRTCPSSPKTLHRPYPRITDSNPHEKFPSFVHCSFEKNYISTYTSPKMAFKHLTQGPSHHTCDVGRYHERSISKDTCCTGHSQT